MAETKQEAATEARTTEGLADGVSRGMSGISSFEHEVMGLVRDTASDTIHVARDVTSEAVRGVGEVGSLTVRTASGLLSDVARGVRDVAGALFHRDSGEPPAKH